MLQRADTARLSEVEGDRTGLARLALAGESIQIGCILHPSPASPAANQNWAELIERQLEQMGVRVP